LDVSLSLSPLPKTWLIDVDGVLFAHNEYLASEQEHPLPGVRRFLEAVPADDVVVLLTARPVSEEPRLRAELARLGLRFDCIVFDLPIGERVLINDCKPSGLPTAHALNLPRDAGLAGVTVRIDQEL
jgi:hypothetical protein